MNFISCDKEYITARYEYLRDHMKGVTRLTSFIVGDWAQPWAFGIDYKAKASVIYKEAIEKIFEEEVESISDDEYTGYVIIALKSDNEIGIVWVSEDEDIFREHMEDLFNAEVINKKSPVNIPASPTPKKPDNLVINRMHIFTRE